MHTSWILSLPEGLSVSTDSSHPIEFASSEGTFALPCPDPDIRQLVPLLVHPGHSVQNLLRQIERHGTPGAGSRLIHFVQQLVRQTLLRIDINDDDRQLVSLVATTPAFSLSRGKLGTGPVLLSRFAYIRRIHDVVTLESPLSPARLLLHDERSIGLLHRLSKPTSLEKLKCAIDGLSADTVEQLWQMLSISGLLTDANTEGLTDEDKSSKLKFWQFHDLLFHATSRVGRHDGPVGAAFLWAGIEDPLPALPGPIGDSSTDIDLPKPDVESLQQQDPPLARVVEERQSIREYGPSPINLEQLGEFLYRIGRVRKQFDLEFDLPGGPVTMDFAARPYPSAGGVYELEIYPLIQNCTGLDAGLYHYNALHHKLEPAPATQNEQSRLLQDAGQAANISADQVQVVLILSARFGRLTWKYSRMAYAAVLKDVGVLYHSMYLTATAMGLAPCSIGSGNSDVFADAIGSDYYEETSVGEFLLGSRAAVETTT